MTEEEILDLIGKGCGQTLELVKESPATDSDRKELAKIMTAFANSGGGIILIGVDKNTYTALGVNPTYNIEDIIKIDKEYCSPLTNPKVSVENVRGIRLISVSIARGMNRPYHTEGDCYVRVDKQVFVASHSEMQDMYKKDGSLRKQDSDFWPVTAASLEDLDKTKIDQYFKNMGIKVEERYREKILKDKGILVESAGRLVPTAAGMLMFGKDPQYFIISSGVRLVKFQGKNIGSVIMDQKEVKGTIPEMIDESWKFIFKHMDARSKVEGLKREDYTEYPTIAVREAIANAIVNRDYSIDGSQVRIFLFDDRIEIYTPGGLAPGVTVTNMEYTQYSRNQYITQMLMYLGQYIEKLGAGIKRIKSSLRHSGLREPIFFDTGVDFILTMFGPIKHQQSAKEELEDRIQKVVGPVKTPQEITFLSKESKRDTLQKNGYLNSNPQSIIEQFKKSKKILPKFIIGAVILFVLALVIFFNTRPVDPLALYYKASVLHSRGEYRDAIDVYSRFIEEFPNSEKADSAQYYLAGCMDILGEQVGALNVYADLLKRYPKSRWVPYAYYWRGEIFLNMGELDKAVAEYQKMLNEYPDHPIALSAMRSIGILYYKQNKFKDAIGMYEKVLDIAEVSNDGYEYYQIGLCYLKLGQKDKAREMFRKVISSEKSSPKMVEQANEELNKLNI
jgi:ATP-dependent DNA helicase RecG